MYVCMYVCLPSLYVCSPSLYVCVYASVRMSGKNQSPEDEVRFPTKNVQYLSFNSTFGDSWEGALRMIRISKTPPPVRLSQDSSAIAAFFKPPLPVRLNPSACEAFSKPLCLSDFFKTPPKHVCMDTKHVCMFAERVYIFWGKSCSRGRGQIPYENVQYLIF